MHHVNLPFPVNIMYGLPSSNCNRFPVLRSMFALLHHTIVLHTAKLQNTTDNLSVYINTISHKVLESLMTRHKLGVVSATLLLYEQNLCLSLNIRSTSFKTARFKKKRERNNVLRFPLTLVNYCKPWIKQK